MSVVGFRRALLALGCLGTLSAAFGCAEEIESPKVTVGSVEPVLVCNAQRLAADAPVVISGSGFTPMPRNVLAEPPILVLPEVTITKTQDLDGSGAGGTEIVFPGEPGERLSNNLVWTSSESMTVRISESPAVELDPGLYDVTVENPDGSHDMTLPQALAVVPPPSIASIEPVPQAVCTAQGARQVTISGSNFLVFGGTKPTVTMTLGDADTDLAAGQVEMSDCSDIPGKNAQLCSTITATLDDTLAPGAYAVRVTSPEPASCVSSEEHTVYIAPPPIVTDIVPPAICVDQTDQVITVNGGNFAQIDVGPNAGDLPVVTIASADGTVQMDYVPTLSDCAVPEGLDAGFGLQLCDTIQITVPTGDLDPGDYTLTVTNPDPVGCASTDPIELTVNPPPSVTGTNPATVCSGGSLLEITGTGFQQGATVQLRCTSGTTVDAVAVDVASDTLATATFGAGVTAGDVCEVVLTNPDGCEDRPEPHQSVTGTEGPILFNVDPHVAYNGIDTKVNLYVTALDGEFTVTMWPDGDPGSAVELEATLAPGKTTVIQATIPEGTAASPDGGPGYTIEVNDESDCLAALPDAVRVTETLVVNDGTVTPPFGPVDDSTAITISLASDPGSTDTPRAFLNPPGTEAAIQLKSVTVLDATTLTAVVPANTPAGTYDLVIVWPDGNVAVITGAYTSQTDAPPVIENVSPQSVEAAAGQSITLTGTGFSGSTVTLQCLTAAGAIVDIDATEQTEVCAAGACTQDATFDASAAGQGAACVVRATNADGSYGEFSAVATTNASLNLAVSPTAGPDLNTARRALVAAGVRASSAARFVYAIGGDDGAVANAMDTVEFAGVDLFGSATAWTDAAEVMTAPRAFAGSTTLGRYIYVVGGNDGSGTVASAERALVLSPDEIPEITNVDLCLSGGGGDCFGVAGLANGLDAGVYSYRVSAVIDPTDPVNLGGETLASDPIILRLRNVDDRQVTVRIDWTAPVDSQGAELSGITGYRIYRTPVDTVPGTDEVLLAEVDAATLSYVDDGSVALGTMAPLPVGSTSAWQALPALGVARQGLGVAAAMDPATAGTWHLYALLGQDSGTAQTSYEFLTITEAANGRQTVAGSWTAGTEAAAEGRYNIGAWRVDDSVSLISSGTTYIYVGAGETGGGRTGRVEVATVAAGGQLSAFDDAGVTDLAGTGVREGYGAVAVGSAGTAALYLFGGRTNNVEGTAYSGAITSGAIPDVAWNAQGPFALQSPRVYMGATVQSANVFLIGGSSTGTNALASTESVVW